MAAGDVRAGDAARARTCRVARAQEGAGADRGAAEAARARAVRLGGRDAVCVPGQPAGACAVRSAAGGARVRGVGRAAPPGEPLPAARPPRHSPRMSGREPPEAGTLPAWARRVPTFHAWLVAARRGVGAARAGVARAAGLALPLTIV